MIPQRLHPGGESVYTSYIFRQSTIPQRLHPGGRKCLYLSYFASLLDLEGYNRVEKVFVSLTFLQSVRPQRLHPGEKVFVPLIFASLLGLQGYNRVERAFVIMMKRISPVHETSKVTPGW